MDDDELREFLLHGEGGRPFRTEYDEPHIPGVNVERVIRGSGMGGEDAALLRWLADTSLTKSVEPVEDPDGSEVADPLPDWREAWSPTSEEAALDPVHSELVTKGLHILADERRITLLGILGMNPNGINGNDIAQRYRHLSGGSLPAQQHINWWLVENGLARVVDRNAMGVRDIEVTDEGMELLPLAGHLLHWSLSGKESLRDVLGFSNKYEPDSTLGYGFSIRPNLEQLRELSQVNGGMLKVADLLKVPASTDAITRRRLKHLQENGWVVPIPGRLQPEASYPVFRPAVELAQPKRISTAGEALRDHMLATYDPDVGGMTVYDMVFKGQYRVASRRSGGPENFTRDVFLEYARLRSSGMIEELDPGSVKLFNVALNPAVATRLTQLIAVVDGAERGSDRFAQDGFTKLAQYLVAPDDSLAKRIEQVTAGNRPG